MRCFLIKKDRGILFYKKYEIALTLQGITVPTLITASSQEVADLCSKTAFSYRGCLSLTAHSLAAWRESGAGGRQESAYTLSSQSE